MLVSLFVYLIYSSSRAWRIADHIQSLPLSLSSDLALSVTMTAISTILAVVMLPLNLYIYTPLAFNDDQVDVMEILDFRALTTSLIVVISAIGLGIFASDKVPHPQFHVYANRVRDVSYHTFISCVYSLLTEYISYPLSNQYCTVWKRCRRISRHTGRHRLQRHRRSRNMATRRQILRRSRHAMRHCPRPLQHDDHVHGSQKARTSHLQYRELLPELWHCHFGRAFHVSGR